MGRLLVALGLLVGCGGSSNTPVDAHVDGPPDVTNNPIDAPTAPSGYLKASNPHEYNHFGASVAISADGNTLAIGATEEDSAATGINGDQASTAASGSGAVYIFTRSSGTWTQQAYIKASNTNTRDGFGVVALSADGNTLAVGARGEASNATGIDGDQTNNTAMHAGAVYIFTRSGITWSQQAYLKASNTDANDYFGGYVSLSDDGSTLAVSANLEDSVATGIDGDQTSNGASDSGAVYVFTRSGSTWTQQAYIKASNTNAGDQFGVRNALSGDGNTLAVGAWYEASNATTINGDQTNNSQSQAGAAYIFTRSGTVWSQQAYIKASNAGNQDQFGVSVALSTDGNALAVGAYSEHSAATGIDGDQADNSMSGAGAMYTFTRSGTTWTQQHYLKASNTGASDWFGISCAMTPDGTHLLVGASFEDSAAQGLNGNGADNSALNSGAAYRFDLATTWSQLAYIKAYNTGATDNFGTSMAMSADASVMVICAMDEASANLPDDNSAPEAGACYVY